MRSTLFYIPHEIAGYPLFGFGIAFGFILLAFATWAIWCVAQKRPKSDWTSTLPVWGIAAAIVVFVIPAVEQTWTDGTPIGLPIRGYGVLVVSGLIAGIGISVLRGRQLGIDPDVVIGLGFWMMLTGVLGARIFYVVQKWEEFGSWSEIFKVTEGGLVIYGGVIGGLVAAGVYCLRHQLNVRATADLVAPGFLLGLAFGRIGCLLHGCCFGGVCTANLPAIQFPHGSGPYTSQIVTGELLGLRTNSRTLPAIIDSVIPDSPADQAHLTAGQTLESIRPFRIPPEKADDPTSPEKVLADVTVDGRAYSFPPQDLPERSLPTHPSQIYSAINALLLCILIWFLQPQPSRDGVAFCVAIALYAISRSLLEGVRSDEAGQLGTSLTIAQWVSIASITAAIAGLALIYRLPKGRTWVWPAI